MSQPEIDHFLADQIEDVDEGKTDLQLVVIADGMFIMGTAITFADFLASWAQNREAVEESLTRLRNAAKERVQRRRQLEGEFLSSLGPDERISDDQKKRLSELDPAYLHLRDVIVFVGNKRINIPHLRVRLTAITGWMQGGLNRDELDGDW